MAGLDRSTWGSLGIVVLAILIVGACSASLPKPLEAPAGTSESAPQPMPEEAPVAESPEAVPPVPEAPIQETTTETPEPSPQPESEPEDPNQILIDTGVTDVTEPPQTLAESEDSTLIVIDTGAKDVTEPPQTLAESEDSTLIVIDTGAKDVTKRPQTLAEAARAERERREIGVPTDIVITDKTLEEFATGDLTVVTPSAAEKERDSGASELQREMAEKEAYWRGGAREIRQAWRDAYDKIPGLEEKVFQLRQAFFREDDGFYRDGEIKPAWDRAIEQLEEAHLEVEARQEELTVFLEEGRTAGALPGWLREGFDLEPDPLVVDEPTAEPGEPVIYQQEATDPP